MLKENYNLLPQSVLMGDYVCVYVPVGFIWCWRSESRASRRQTVVLSVNRWGHVLAELTG